MSKRVPSHLKFREFIISLLEGPLNLASLAERLVQRYGVKYSTARPAVTRIYKELLEYGHIREVGTDKRGSKIVDLTPKALVHLITMATSYGAKCLGLDYSVIRKAVERICPEILPAYDELAKIYGIIDAERDCGKEKPERLLESEYFWAAEVEEVFEKGDKDITCEDVKESMLNIIRDVVHTIVYEFKAEKAWEFLRKMASLKLSDEAKHLIKEGIENEINEIRKEIRVLRKKLKMYEEALKMFNS